MTLKVFSMFSGIGGFELGIRNSALDHDLVGWSEIDPWACSVFEKHIAKGAIKNYGDSTKIRTTELPEFDVLVGGFPCQPFSIASPTRLGFDDTQGTHFFDIARICAAKTPRYLVLENVRGLLSHGSSKTFQTILRILAHLGYGACEWQILNSKDHGVPQNRQRIILVGYLGGFPRRTLFSIRGSSEDDNGSIDREPSQREPLIRIDRKANIKKDPQTAGTLSVGGHGSGNHSDMDLIVQPMRDWTIRRLTPVEWERLQGFPDNWTAGLSNTQRYKALGNAVTTNVITAIFNNLAKNSAQETRSNG